MAPTFAVRGNVDRGTWAESLAVIAVSRPVRTQLHVLHILEDLNLAPEVAGFSVVISGHSHKPHAETRCGVLYVNLGSASLRRFRLPVTVAQFRVTVSGLGILDDGRRNMRGAPRSFIGLWTLPSHCPSWRSFLEHGRSI